MRRHVAGLASRSRPRLPPRILGWLFLGVYGLLLALIALFVAASSGDMSGLLFVFPALPWPLVGMWIYRPGGFGYGVLAGLVLNGALAYALGFWVGWLRSRR